MNSFLLNRSFSLGEYRIPNRVVFQPMEGCDCEEDGTPSPLTVRKYLRAAKSGVGILWFEATAVCPEGRTNVRQMMLTEDNLSAFRQLTEQVRQTARKETGVCPLLILQLNHSGRQSITPMVAYRNPVYDERRGVTDEHIVTDEYLDTLPSRYATTAALAMEAGFDGVDVKSCHGYLFQELLSAFGREGRYGGCFENRTRLFLDCFRAVRKVLPSHGLLTARLSVSDMVPKPYGFGTDGENRLDFSEPDRLIRQLLAEGLQILNVTVGNPYYNPHVNRPYRRGGYLPPETAEEGLARFVTIESHLKQTFPALPLVASGLSYYRADLMEKSEDLLREGVCDFVGYGRETLAYPMFYRDWSQGRFDYKKCCVTCSKCTELMRGKRACGCAVFDEYYRELYKELKK